MKSRENENTFLKISKSGIINEEHLNQIKSKEFVIFFIIIFVLAISFYQIYLSKKNNNQINKILTRLQKDEIDNNIHLIEPYIKAQNEFCDNPNKYINTKYENQIYLSDVKFNDFNFKMYIFKSNNFILNEFKKYGAFEINISNSMIQTLSYYKSKYNIINNEDIFVIDIGGNIGWYPSILGRYGYTILSFEAFEKNYYVERKNFCNINKYSNVIIVNKGLGNKEKRCNYFIHKNNEGNGMVICDDKKTLKNSKLKRKFMKESEVEITTLKYFMPYLSNKKIVLMKIDVEGHELHVLEGGEELITKYHVPFIVLEFSPLYLKEAGTEPKSLIQFLVNNGYKISIKGFLSNEFISIEELIRITTFQINCYFIHDSVIK